MNRHFHLASLAILLLLCGVFCASVFSQSSPSQDGVAQDGDGLVREIVYWSDELPVDEIYRSMLGPENLKILQLGEKLGETEDPEILWITGYQADIVGAADKALLSPEYMCHSILSINDMSALGDRRTGNRRLFTLSQGQMAVDFPSGFGIPILSSEGLSLWSQILNLNPQDEKFDVRHQVTIRYVRDRDLDEPMIPLFERPAQAMVLVEEEEEEPELGFQIETGLEAEDGTGAHFGVQDADSETHGPGCAVGVPAFENSHIYSDEKQTFSAHWLVPPGRQEHRTLVTQWLDVPFDTRIHYISVHVHPFAESLELRDLTTGESLFKSNVRGAEGRIGIDELNSFSSAEGIPVYKDHDYELVSVYNNTSDEDQDAMAILLIYMRDHPDTEPGDVREALQIAAFGAPPWSLDAWSPLTLFSAFAALVLGLLSITFLANSRLRAGADAASAS